MVGLVMDVRYDKIIVSARFYGVIIVYVNNAN